MSKNREEAAQQRTEYVAALEKEKADYERAGLTSKADEVTAEIKRTSSDAPKARRTPKATQADA